VVKKLYKHAFPQNIVTSLQIVSCDKTKEEIDIYFVFSDMCWTAV